MTALRRLIAILTISTLFAGCGEVHTEKIVEQKQASFNFDSLPDLKKIVDRLVEGNSVESPFIGDADSPSSQWDTYENLEKVATIDQLIALTNYTNATVQCYAFQALAKKRSNQTFKILLNHLYDTSMVNTLNGCIGMTQLIGDYFIEVVTLNYEESDSYKLNQTEKKILDSILFNDRLIKLSARSSVLDSLKLNATNYPRLRQLVNEDRDESALRKLAKYQKQTDKELIASFFKDDDTQSSALCAVREFPDDYFYRFVIKVFEQEWKQDRYNYGKWRICYQVLAKYPHPETIELFDRTTNLKDEFRYQTLCKHLLVAITKYPDKLYNPIKLKIKLSSYNMDEVKNQLANDY